MFSWRTFDAVSARDSAIAGVARDDVLECFSILFYFGKHPFHGRVVVGLGCETTSKNNMMERQIVCSEPPVDCSKLNFNNTSQLPVP